MPSDKRSSMTAKATGIILSLFDVASSGHVSFGIPQYIQCTYHGLLPLSSFVYHFFLLTVKAVNSRVASAMASLWELSVFSMVTAEVLLLLFFICNAVKWVEHSQKQSVMPLTRQ